METSRVKGREQTCLQKWPDIISAFLRDYHWGRRFPRMLQSRPLWCSLCWVWKATWISCPRKCNSLAEASCWSCLLHEYKVPYSKPKMQSNLCNWNKRQIFVCNWWQISNTLNTWLTSGIWSHVYLTFIWDGKETSTKYLCSFRKITSLQRILKRKIRTKFHIIRIPLHTFYTDFLGKFFLAWKSSCNRIENKLSERGNLSVNF